MAEVLPYHVPEDSYLKSGRIGMARNSLHFGMQSGGVATQYTSHIFIDLLQSSILSNRISVQQFL